MYCDDGIMFIATESVKEAEAIADSLISELQNLGLTLSEAKSYPTVKVSHLVEHIGFRIDLEEERLYVKAKRLQKIKTLTRQLLEAETWTPRMLQQFGGQIMSCIPVLGNKAFLCT